MLNEASEETNRTDEVVMVKDTRKVDKRRIQYSPSKAQIGLIVRDDSDN